MLENLAVGLQESRVRSAFPFAAALSTVITESYSNLPGGSACHAQRELVT